MNWRSMKRCSTRSMMVAFWFPSSWSAKGGAVACLIRDINNDLWKAPNDIEFSEFVIEVKNLIVPVLIAVDKYGLKKRNQSLKGR